jgi:hypothetical protein
MKNFLLISFLFVLSSISVLGQSPWANPGIVSKADPHGIQGRQKKGDVKSHQGSARRNGKDQNRKSASFGKDGHVSRHDQKSLDDCRTDERRRRREQHNTIANINLRRAGKHPSRS